jgi:hypothetical protein
MPPKSARSSCVATLPPTSTRAGAWVSSCRLVS